MIIDRIALILAVIGGLNWGLVGLFRFDLAGELKYTVPARRHGCGKN